MGIFPWRYQHPWFIDVVGQELDIGEMSRNFCQQFVEGESDMPIISAIGVAADSRGLKTGQCAEPQIAARDVQSESHSFDEFSTAQRQEWGDAFMY